VKGVDLFKFLLTKKKSKILKIKINEIESLSIGINKWDELEKNFF
jgi:hypothetical protein